MAYPSKVSKKSTTYPGKVRLIELLEDLIEDDADAIEDYLDDSDYNSLHEVPLASLRSLYDRYIRNPASTARKPKINPKECAVEQFAATVITDKSRRLVNISIEDNDGKFLTPDLERHDRPLGGEMPVFLSLPQELYEAIRAA